MLGMHYIVFLAINNETVASDSATLRVKVAFEMIFTSFQGCLISILYCFLSGEVQGEIIKVWSTWRRRKGVPAAGSRNCSLFYSNGVQLTSIASSHTACDESSSSNLNASHD
ncbi:vasoactive intestinal polypeptide receptor 1-like isoform X2 [Clavelina lepadiformis]